MKKIISLFQRNYDTDKLVRDEIVPGAEWVIEGQGIATRKFDGTCCMIKNGKLFKRYDVKKGKKAPENFEPAQEADTITGHWPGWLPVTESKEDQWFNEGFENLKKSLNEDIPDGTYELCGPKVQNNLENFSEHILIPHGKENFAECPRKFEEIKQYLIDKNIEGIVWHNNDGSMVKIKKKDFGFDR